MRGLIQNMALKRPSMWSFRKTQKRSKRNSQKKELSRLTYRTYMASASISRNHQIEWLAISPLTLHPKFPPSRKIKSLSTASNPCQKFQLSKRRGLLRRIPCYIWTLIRHVTILKFPRIRVCHLIRCTRQKWAPRRTRREPILCAKVLSKGSKPCSNLTYRRSSNSLACTLTFQIRVLRSQNPVSTSVFDF